MKKMGWFISGFVACLVALCLAILMQSIRHRFGTISYNGDPVEVTSTLSEEPVLIGKKGTALPYGMYKMKLRSGKTLNIHKNNRGNIEVTEKDGIVLISADHNVIDVRIEH